MTDADRNMLALADRLQADALLHHDGAARRAYVEATASDREINKSIETQERPNDGQQ